MKITKIYILAFVFLSLGGCSKGFLDVEPITNPTETNFYKTPEDAYTALVGCYDGLQTVWADGVSFPVASELLSDNCFGGTGASDAYGYQMIDEFDKNRSPSDQDLFGANWSAYYKAIFRCNMLIGKMDQIDWSSNPTLRNTYESEVRFLRAYLYFDMVRLWGNIPLLTAPSKENIPQSSAEEVFKTIAEDLKFAADNLPATNYAAQPVATHGRVTKWAAEALLGRVYLFYTGYYAKPDLAGVVTKAQALTYLENVVTNGGFGLVGDFANLWPASLTGYVGEDNRETVFGIKYTYTSDYAGNIDGNHWMVMYGMREQYSYPYGNGWGGATVNPKLYNAYLATDTRKAASTIAIAEEKIPFVNQNKQREYTGYYVKKYAPLVDEAGNSIAVNNGAANFMIGQFEDYVAIRYSDVLLMAAELGSANAQTYFDDVRRRAYQGAFTPLAISQDNIMKERRLEFAFEGIRFWDLLRRGVNVAAQEIAETTTVLNGGKPATKTITAAKITETKGWQQIPNSEVALSTGVLKQNPGW
ncbi:RagB/SusD family nutrient uptake outer membrane protein [Arcticibacter eurypsychrophilus]|uniref:RagB/SusD family nutrient uptake outer membrane protein n=1 Tax=Arcticibacter eurypsychrophilus TaxID=1434752 RepID=UPI00084D0BD2|nr:RagB/SusD family nutrient uptake outer membrane protein [Arcticibacter eurypsychrophilus]